MFITSLIAKFRYAARGLAYAIRRERSFRFELAGAVAVQLVAWALDFSVLAWSVATLATVVVLVAEMFNTALERLMDVVEPRLMDVVALLKNLLAAAVLLSVAGAALVVIGLSLAAAG